jgi:ADP-dependent NAD(P)H-hydrate dehydratase / NAD(P)H-hydrate epimerase
VKVRVKKIIAKLSKTKVVTVKVKSHALVQSMFLPALPSRALDTHKGSFGSVVIVGGDTGMVGAVLLAARAALFCGAGRVYAAFLADNPPNVDTCHPEIMLHSASSLTNLTRLNCVVIGTGLGQSKTAIDLLAFSLVQEVALLIDADALNLISQHTHLQIILKNRQSETIVTPHPTEAARLLNTTVENIQENRIDSAKNLAAKFNVICVLKGSGTIVADNNGDYFINTTGNPGLASGGTGDVLSGIIGSLVAQGLSVLEAAKLGVYVHGAAADTLVAEGIGPVGLTASEVAQEARHQINMLNKLALNNLKLEGHLL